jgi:hypothetical protein
MLVRPETVENGKQQLISFFSTLLFLNIEVMKANSPYISLLALVSAALFIAACGKDPDPPQPAGSETLKFHIHNTVGTSPFVVDTEYSNAQGKKFTFSHFKYYVSNIGLIKQDGSTLSMGSKVLLVDPTVAEYEIGEVPVGSYKGFFFHVGLDSLTNHGDPSTYDVGHPLAYQTPSMHWSWSTGYLFLKAEGLVDTSAAGGSPTVPVEYHIAVDDLYRRVDFTTSALQVADGSDAVINLNFDIYKLFENVDMATERLTHTFDDMPLAEKIANNYQASFSLE